MQKATIQLGVAVGGWRAKEILLSDCCAHFSGFLFERDSVQNVGINFSKHSLDQVPVTL